MGIVMCISVQEICSNRMAYEGQRDGGDGDKERACMVVYITGESNREGMRGNAVRVRQDSKNDSEGPDGVAWIFFSSSHCVGGGGDCGPCFESCCWWWPMVIVYEEFLYAICFPTSWGSCVEDRVSCTDNVGDGSGAPEADR